MAQKLKIIIILLLFYLSITAVTRSTRCNLTLSWESLDLIDWVSLIWLWPFFSVPCSPSSSSTVNFRPISTSKPTTIATIVFPSSVNIKKAPLSVVNPKMLCDLCQSLFPSLCCSLLELARRCENYFHCTFNTISTSSRWIELGK